MKIKVGRHEFNVTDKDYILDNGACYQLITQKIDKGYWKETPVISKTLFEKLKKKNLIILSSKKYKNSFGELSDSCRLWQFKED